MARVVVGLSGGVDSSVAAALLLEQGHEVIGLFMRNWNDESVVINNECPWVDDSNDALIVAQSLGIPFQVLDLSEAYRARIVDYMFAEYERGRTPNPDVLCNREIKFDVFLEAALGLGADFVATGHYCRKAERLDAQGQPVYQLLAGVDGGKDQSYFLCQLNQAQLAKALFPIGHLQKAEVRRIAQAHGLITAEKKDSQGLCFVGKVKLPVFLQQQLAPKAGDILDLSAQDPIFAPRPWPQAYTEAELALLAQPWALAEAQAKKLGEHQGAHYYTVGQRKGLQVGGLKEPIFVLGVDTQRNVVYTGQGQEHPGLYRPALFIPQSDVHWIEPDRALAPGQSLTLSLRIRYRQPLVPATLYQTQAGLYIIFEQAQRGVTPGQFAAWYEGQTLLGSGVIA